MVSFNMISRAIPSAENFIKIYHRRLKAKADGDTVLASVLKLVLNTTYGISINQYNKVYDPRMGRSVCITGQLLLTDLIVGLAFVESIRMIQYNTDSVTFSIEDRYLPDAKTVIDEWQERTGLKLEEDRIKKIIQKDVNNYIVVFLDGKIKVKGGLLKKGTNDKDGAWNINNNLTIISRSLIEYFVNGISPENTIMTHPDILDFQQIAKSGSKYENPFQIICDQKVPIQSTNRVYATAIESYGTLYHIKKDTGSISKQPGGLPEHCIIDNSNQLSIENLDRQWYIEETYKWISEFTHQKVS